MRTFIITVALAALTLTGCGDSQPPAAEAPTAAPATTAAPKVDPYKVYLSKAPKGEKTLSREDAALRASLGCGKTWPPGTVDAVLAEAYAAYC